jgi:hypothetical protein
MAMDILGHSLAHAADADLRPFWHAAANDKSGASKRRRLVGHAHAVQNQASVLSYIDGFMLLGLATIGALLLMLALKDPPVHPVTLGTAAAVAPG